MALPQINLLYGDPVTDPWDSFYDSAYGGVLAPPTATEIVIAAEDGHRIVFKGTFTVAGGDVTGGTMTGYTVFAGDTKVIEANGYTTDGAALFDSLQTFNVDNDPFFDLLFGIALKVKGSNFDDVFEGGPLGDVILGRAGNDRLFGWDGDDLIKGGTGNDLIVGGNGSDTLFGGSGHDTFAFFLDPMAPPTGFSKIKDFEPGEDLIGIQAALEGLKPGFLDKTSFHKGTVATTAEQVVIYDKKTGNIFFDVDGTGIAAQFQFAKVTAGTKLHGGDFFAESTMMIF